MPLSHSNQDDAMNCPNCNTWNPDDKDLCWRCQTPMPKPPPPKKKRTAGFSAWAWVVISLLFALAMMAQCYFFPVTL